MNKNDCKIVQDLLPNYIEKLTNEETNNYIDEHIQECTECKKIYENMQKDFNVNTNKSEKKEIKYFKKFNNKLKILKILLLLIVVLFLSNYGYKICIVKSMQNKIKQYENITNYKMMKSSYKGESIDFYNIFHIENSYIIKINSIAQNRNYELIATSEGNCYINSDGDKVAIIGAAPLYASNKIYNYLETESLFQLLYSTFISKITTVKYNDIECYKIENFQSPDVLYSEYGFTLYIEKNTGLLVRLESGIPVGDKIFTSVDDYKYEFNTVTEDDLKEPNVSEYRIENSNNTN